MREKGTRSCIYWPNNKILLSKNAVGFHSQLLGSSLVALGFGCMMHDYPNLKNQQKKERKNKIK